MKRFSLPIIVASSVLFCGAVVAQEGTEDFKSQKLSSRTRADVIAELREAQAAGLLEHRGESYHGYDRTPFVSTKTRAQVLAELEAARGAGLLETRNYADTYGSFRAGDTLSTRTRAEVRAELAEAQKSQAGLSRGERSGS